MSIDFTIGMAIFRNYDEAYFTIQCLRFYHAEAMERFEIVIVDNDPEGPDGKAIRSLIEGRCRRDVDRYIQFPEPKGSVPPRAHLFDVARGKFIVCIDSHVLFEPGSLDRLVKFFDDNPESDDFLQGPLLSNYGPHRIEGTHMSPRWRSQMFGTWAVDGRGRDPESEPFEIPQHGLGFFAARRESWLGFPPDLVGFSGGEGYIHEAYRQAGRRTLCLPGVRWYHKFSRVTPAHRPSVEDKIRNHVRGWRRLGVDLQTGSTEEPVESICAHFVGGAGTRDGKGVISFATFKSLCREAGHVYTGEDPNTRPDGIIIGPINYGSYRMRGRPLVDEFGFCEIDRRAEIEGDYDLAIVVKHPVSAKVRRKCERVIWCPLDMWFSNREESQLHPGQWIERKFKAGPFDDLIVETIALKKAAESVLPDSVRVHLVPHHADPRVLPDWYDPKGPIVYAGARHFVPEASKNVIREAAAKIKRSVKFDHNHHAWKALKGASLVLYPRLGIRTRMNLQCKPCVKVANAAQAGIPVLATDEPAIGDLYPDIRSGTPKEWGAVDRLAEMMISALADDPSIVRFPFDRWIVRMREIIG